MQPKLIGSKMELRVNYWQRERLMGLKLKHIHPCARGKPRIPQP